MSLISVAVHAQALVVKVQPDSLKAKKYFNVTRQFGDIADIKNHLLFQVDSLKKEGFLGVSVDSILEEGGSVVLKLYLGPKLENLSLTNGSIAPELYSKAFSNRIYNWSEYIEARQKLLELYLDQGKIQTEVYLDDFNYRNGYFNAKVYSNLGEEYMLDSLIVKGDVEISSKYLKQYFDYEPKQLITKKFLDRMRKRGEQASFFRLKEEPGLRFKEDGLADIYVTFAEKKANQFDLLLGFLPNPNPRLTDQNFLITGDGNLLLMNPFGQGREFSIDYKQLQPESPILDASFYLPIVFRQNFGARGSFNLEKQDSSFVNLNYRIGADYQFSGNKHLSFNFKNTTSFLQQIDTNLVKLNKELPPSIDFKQQLYVAEFISNSLNSTIAPTEGLSLSIDFGAGNRKIVENTSVTTINDGSGFNYANLYQGVNNDQLTIQSNTLVHYFIPIKNTSTVLLKNESGYKYYANYFNNDFYRLGGINDLRGFDERSLLSNLYTINTAEYRLLLNRESFFSVFTDVGYLKNDRIDNDDLLLGVGSGLDLSTKAGIFSIKLAVGKDNDNPFDLNRTRIHFGYVNVF